MRISSNTRSTHSRTTILSNFFSFRSASQSHRQYGLARNQPGESVALLFSSSLIRLEAGKNSDNNVRSRDSDHKEQNTYYVDEILVRR